MIKKHHPKENIYHAIDLSESILNHSADKTIVYKSVGETPNYIGYYFPEKYDNRKKYPVFIMVHGGGWCFHKIFEDQPHWQGDYLGYLARYYAEKGFISVSIDYRLARNMGQDKGYGILECYEDCCDGVDYIIKTANDYGIDTEKMYLLGESAGGHLAGALATFRYKKSYSFKQVFLVNPITYMDDDKWKKYIPLHNENLYLQNLSFEQRIEFLSPLYQVDKRIGKVVLIHGESDKSVNLEHSVKFYNRMNDISENCELHVLKETNHAFLLAEYSRETEACMTGIQIINKSLGI